MYYISGPFYGKYNLVAPSGYCNWREQTCDYNYNIITIIYIDIYGNLYIGRVSDKVSNPRRDSTMNLDTGNINITYKEFFELIYKNPFLDGPVLKEKLLTDCTYNQIYSGKIYGDNKIYVYAPFANSSQYKSNALKINLSQDEINNKKLEVFNEIKKDISNDIFNTCKLIKKISCDINLKNNSFDRNRDKTIDQSNRHQQEITQMTRELNNFISKYNIPFKSFSDTSDTDECLIKNINHFLKLYVGEIKYEFFENDSNINIINYINNSIKINKLDKELLEKQEKQKIENERLIKIKEKEELEKIRKKQEELLKQQKLNNAIQSII